MSFGVITSYPQVFRIVWIRKITLELLQTIYSPDKKQKRLRHKICFRLLGGRLANLALVSSCTKCQKVNGVSWLLISQRMFLNGPIRPLFLIFRSAQNQITNIVSFLTIFKPGTAEDGRYRQSHWDIVAPYSQRMLIHYNAETGGLFWYWPIKFVNRASDEFLLLPLGNKQ